MRYGKIFFEQTTDEVRSIFEPGKVFTTDKVTVFSGKAEDLAARLERMTADPIAYWGSETEAARYGARAANEIRQWLDEGYTHEVCTLYRTPAITVNFQRYEPGQWCEPRLEIPSVGPLGFAEVVEVLRKLGQTRAFPQTPDALLAKLRRLKATPVTFCNGYKVRGIP